MDNTNNAFDAHGYSVWIPCKKGDKLFVLTTDSPTGIEETKCKKININFKNGRPYANIIAPCVFDDWGNAVRELRSDDFGKIVFFTLKEAEEALAAEKQTQNEKTYVDEVIGEMELPYNQQALVRLDSNGGLYIETPEDLCKENIQDCTMEMYAIRLNSVLSGLMSYELCQTENKGWACVYQTSDGVGSKTTLTTLASEPQGALASCQELMSNIQQQYNPQHKTLKSLQEEWLTTTFNEIQNKIPSFPNASRLVAEKIDDKIAIGLLTANYKDALVAAAFISKSGIVISGSSDRMNDAECSRIHGCANLQELFDEISKWN